MKVGRRILVAGAALRASHALWLHWARKARPVASSTSTPRPMTLTNGNCTLREAVQSLGGSRAGRLLGGSTINVPAGTITLTMGQIEIFDDGTITGAGSGSTIVDGNENDRVFNISSKGGPISPSRSQG